LHPFFSLKISTKDVIIPVILSCNSLELYIIPAPGASVYPNNSQKPCPHCGQKDTLVHTKTMISRNVVLLKHSESGYYLETTTVIINRCRCLNKECASKFRVLPADIHPRKMYSISAIIYLCYFYITHNYTYRNSIHNALTNDPESGIPPHFTTIHRWISGLGRMFLELPMLPNLQFIPLRILFQITSDYHFGFYEFFIKIVIVVDENKYRSQRRLEELEAVGELFLLSNQYFPGTQYNSLSKWGGWLIDRTSYVQSFVFPTGYTIRPFNNSS